MEEVQVVEVADPKEEAEKELGAKKEEVAVAVAEVVQENSTVPAASRMKIHVAV